ncbi:conserved Plasmodium protein, unknown function [Plasmodium berghei]|uniref:Spatacsin C-terminal domain-containing protein n=2 Tax=Plasmodium berghei TaxID=5821 RepID=A0A509APZ5_PLABA|nr:conserved Plasmodium protein, unknown function [Plasmodium berghei ANKA]SCL97049.1 conserved Plasmodium protein, unknown function [Plasmodium berghei]SCM16542.1 conserved Plasmodium protein, unknown function [Plasmodium berghei]SCN27766.1 conserved Plasmodium protein, unknown function [Plasmodium berghei]VUC57648.1 conserved Plasmodium protein, unknown function [Plasmodium berghei ANKA]|eukprot:XP_034423419.1 conserved Plasmodium protein, unknown function [Plasmodium berghei ANKA]
MNDLVCLKLLKTKKGNNRNKIYTILPNDSNNIIALLYIKNGKNIKEENFKLYFNVLNSYSDDILLNNNTINAFWIYCNKDIFTKNKVVKPQIPILVSQQHDHLNFYFFTNVHKINSHLESRGIVIKDERLYFDIYNKTDGKTYEHNTLYNFYITYDKLFQFMESFNKNLSILESFSKKFIKIILKDENSFFIILNDIICAEFVSNGLCLQAKKIFALQNILMDVDNYIYFSKCISRNDFLFLLTLTPQQFLIIFKEEVPYLAININKHVLTFFKDFEVNYDVSTVLLIDLYNHVWSFDIRAFSDLYLFEEKDKTSLKRNIKIKSVKIHPLYLKGDPEKNIKVNDIKNVYKEIYCKNNYINECNSDNHTKINFKSYFPDYFKFTQKKIYVNKNYNNNDDCSISLKSYKYLEYSKYSYIICKLKKIYLLNSEKLYQTIKSVEIENEEKTIRGNFDILYFYVQNENYNYSLNKISFSNYENSIQIFNNNYEGNIECMTSQLNNIQIDYYIEEKYNILQNEEIYNSVVDQKNRINHSMDHTNILYDNNNNEIENYSYDINTVKDNYENINVHKLKNIESMVNSLNSMLPKYIQLINMYPIYCDIKKLFLISRFKWDYNKNYYEYKKNINNNLIYNKSIYKNRKLLYRKKLNLVKINSCKEYYFIEIFFFKKNDNINKRHVIVLRKTKVNRNVEFLLVLKNYNYFYVNEKKKHYLFNVDNTLCKLIFKNNINTLISICAYNIREKAESIIKVNNLKRQYYYFIMLYNGFLNKNIFLIKKSLNIHKFKEMLLFCRILFHYIWNNFNMDIIYFYFIDYFSFINHIWKKKYKNKFKYIKKQIKEKKEFIQIYFSLNLKKIFDIVDIVGKKYLCFQNNKELKNSLMKDIFDANHKMSQKKINLDNNKYKMKNKNMVQKNENKKSQAKSQQVQKMQMPNSSNNENYSLRNSKTKTKSHFIKPDKCTSNDKNFNNFEQIYNNIINVEKIKGNVNSNSINKINNSNKIIAMDHNQTNNLNNYKESVRNSSYGGMKKMNKKKKKNEEKKVSIFSKDQTTDIDTEQIRQNNNYNNLNNKYLQILEFYYFEKMCYNEHYNIFVNKKYSMEICTITLHFIISFIDRFGEKINNKKILGKNKMKKIFLEMNKYIYMVKMIMSIIERNYYANIEKKTKRNVSKINVWRDDNFFYKYNGNNCEQNFINHAYINVYNMYDTISEMLYVEKLHSDKISKLIHNHYYDFNTSNINNQVDKFKYKNDEDKSNHDLPLQAVNKNAENEQINLKDKVHNINRLLNLHRNEKLMMYNNTKDTITNCTYDRKIYSTYKLESIMNNEYRDMLNENDYKKLFFCLCYCYTIITKMKKIPYLNMKNILYKEVINSNKLINKNITFDYVIYGILNNNNLSATIYYIYSKKYEFLFNFIVLYFNYYILHNFFLNTRNVFIKKFYGFFTRVIENYNTGIKNDDVDKNCENNKLNRKGEKDKTKKEKKKTSEYYSFFNNFLNAIINDFDNIINKKEGSTYNRFIYDLFEIIQNYELHRRNAYKKMINSKDAVDPIISHKMDYNNNTHKTDIVPREGNCNYIEMDKFNSINKTDQNLNNSKRYWNNSYFGKNCIIDAIYEIYNMYYNIKDNFIKLENEINEKNMDSVFNFHYNLKNSIKCNLQNIILLIYKLIIKDKKINKTNNCIKDQIMKQLIRNSKIPFAFMHLNPHEIIINYYGKVIYRLLCNNIDNYLDVCIYILKILCVDVLKFFKAIAFYTVKKYIRNKLVLFLTKNKCSFNLVDKKAIKFISILEIFYKNSSYTTEHNNEYTRYILNNNIFRLYENMTFFKAFKKNILQAGYNYIFNITYKEKNVLNIFNYLINVYNKLFSQNTSFLSYFNQMSFLFIPFIIQNFYCTYDISILDVGQKHIDKERRKKNQSKLKDTHLFLRNVKINYKKKKKKTRGIIMTADNYWHHKRNMHAYTKNKSIIRYSKILHKIRNERWMRHFKLNKISHKTNKWIKISTYKISDFYRNSFINNNKRISNIEGTKNFNKKHALSKTDLKNELNYDESIKSLENKYDKNKYHIPNNVEAIKELMNTEKYMNHDNKNTSLNFSNKSVYCYYANKKGNENIITYNMGKNWMKLKGKEIDDLIYICHKNLDKNIIKENNIKSINKYIHDFNANKNPWHCDYNYDNECYCYLCFTNKNEYQEKHLKKKKKKVECKNEEEFMSMPIDYNYCNVDAIDIFVLHNNHIIEKVSEIDYKDKVITNDKNNEYSYVNNTFILEKNCNINKQYTNLSSNKITTLSENNQNEKYNHSITHEDKMNRSSYGVAAPVLKTYENYAYNYKLIPLEVSTHGSYLCCSLSMLKTVNTNIMLRIVLEKRGILFLHFILNYFLIKNAKRRTKCPMKNEIYTRNSFLIVREKKYENIKERHQQRHNISDSTYPLLISNQYDEDLIVFNNMAKGNNQYCKENKKNIVNNLNAKPIYKHVVLKNCNNNKKKKIKIKSLFYELIKLMNIKSYDDKLFIYILNYYIDNNNISIIFVVLLTLKYFSTNFFKTLHKSKEFNFYEIIKIGTKYKSLNEKNDKTYTSNENIKEKRSKFCSKKHKNIDFNISINLYEKYFLKIISYIQNNLRNKANSFIYEYIESFLECLGIFLYKFDFLYNLTFLNSCSSSPCVCLKNKKNSECIQKTNLKVLDKLGSNKNEHNFFSLNILKSRNPDIYISYNMMTKLSRNFLLFNYLSYEHINNKFGMNSHNYFGDNNVFTLYNEKYVSTNKINNFHKFVLSYFLANQTYTSMYFFILKNLSLFQSFKNCNYLVKHVYRKEEKKHVLLNISSNLYISYAPCYLYSRLSNNLLPLSLYNAGVIFIYELKSYLLKNKKISKKTCLNKDRLMDISACDKEIEYKENENNEVDFNEWNISQSINKMCKKILRKDIDDIYYIPLNILSFLNVKLFLCIFVFSSVDIFDFNTNNLDNPLYVNIYYFKKLTKCFATSVYEAYFGCKSNFKKSIKQKLEEEKRLNKHIFKLAIENLKRYKENYINIVNREKGTENDKHEIRNSYEKSNPLIKFEISNNNQYQFCFENIALIKKIKNKNYEYKDKDNFSLMQKLRSIKHIKDDCKKNKHIYNGRINFDKVFDFYTCNKDLSLKFLLKKYIDESFFQKYFSPFSLFENIFKNENEAYADIDQYRLYDKTENEKSTTNKLDRIVSNEHILYNNHNTAKTKNMKELYNFNDFFAYIRKWKNCEEIIKIKNGFCNDNDIHICKDNTQHFNENKFNKYCNNNSIYAICSTHLKENQLYFLKYFNIKYFLTTFQPLIAYHILILNCIFYKYDKSNNFEDYLYVNNYDVKLLNDYIISNNITLPLKLEECLKNMLIKLCLELAIFYFNNNNILCSILCFLDLCNIRIEKLKMYILSMKSVHYYFKKNYKRKTFWDKWIKKCFQFFNIKNSFHINSSQKNKSIFYESFTSLHIDFYELFNKTFIELVVIKLFLELSKENDEFEQIGKKTNNKYEDDKNSSTNIRRDVISSNFYDNKQAVLNNTVGNMHANNTKTQYSNFQSTYNVFERRNNLSEMEKFTQIMEYSDIDKKKEKKYLSSEESTKNYPNKEVNCNISAYEKPNFIESNDKKISSIDDNKNENNKNKVNYYTYKEDSVKMFILILLEKSIQYRIKEKKKKKKKKIYNDFLNIIPLYCNVNNVHQPLTLLHILSRKNDIFVFFYECIDKKIDIKTCQDIINLYTKNKYTKKNISIFLEHMKKNMSFLIKLQNMIKNNKLLDIRNYSKENNNDLIKYSIENIESESLTISDISVRWLPSNSSNISLVLLEKLKKVFITNTDFYSIESTSKYANKSALQILYTIIYSDFDYKNVQFAIEFIIQNNHNYTKFYIYLTAYVEFIFKNNYPYLFLKKCKYVVEKEFLEKNENSINLKKYEKLFGLNFNTHNELKTFLMHFKKKKEEYDSLIILLKNMWLFFQIIDYLLFLSKIQVIDTNKLKFYNFIQNLTNYKDKSSDLFFKIINKEETTYSLVFFLIANDIFNLLRRFFYIFYFDTPIFCLYNFVKCIKSYKISKAKYYLQKHYNKYIKIDKRNSSDNLYHIFCTHVINYLLLDLPHIRYFILKILMETKFDYKYRFYYYTYKNLYSLNLEKEIYMDIFRVCEELISQNKFTYIKNMLSKIYSQIEDIEQYAFEYNKLFIMLNKFVLLHYSCFKKFIHIIKNRKSKDDYISLLYHNSLSFGYSKVIFLLFLLNYSYSFQSRLSIFEQIHILFLCIFLINVIKNKEPNYKKNNINKKKSIYTFNYVKNKVHISENLFNNKSMRKNKDDKIRQKNNTKLCILKFLPLNDEEYKKIFLFKDYNENRKKYIKYYNGGILNFEIYNKYINLRNQFYNYSEKYFYDFTKNINIIKYLCIHKHTIKNLKLKLIYLLSLSTKSKISINFDKLSISYIKDILKGISSWTNWNTNVHVHCVTKNIYVDSEKQAQKKLNKMMNPIYRNSQLNNSKNRIKDKKNHEYNHNAAMNSLETLHIIENSRNNNNHTSSRNSIRANENSVSNIKILDAYRAENCNENIMKNNNFKGTDNYHPNKSNNNLDSKFIFIVKESNDNELSKTNTNLLLSIFICINNLINNLDVIKAQYIIDNFYIDKIYDEIKCDEKNKMSAELLENKKNNECDYNSKRLNKFNSIKKKKIGKDSFSNIAKNTNICSYFYEYLNEEEQENSYHYNSLCKIGNYEINQFNILNPESKKKDDIDVKKNIEIKLNLNNNDSFLKIDDIYKYIYYNSVYSLVIFYYLCIDAKFGLQLMKLFNYPKTKNRNKCNNAYALFFNNAISRCSSDIYKFVLQSQLLFCIKRNTYIVLRPIFCDFKNEVPILKIFYYVLKYFIKVKKGTTYDALAGNKFIHLFNSRLNLVCANLLVYHNFILFLLDNFYVCSYKKYICTNCKKQCYTNHTHSKDININNYDTKININEYAANSKNKYESNKAFIYYECSYEFLNKHINLVSTNSCSILYKRFYFKTILDAYFYILKILIKNRYSKNILNDQKGYKEAKDRKRQRKSYYCSIGDIRKLLPSVKYSGPHLSNYLFSNLITIYVSNNIILPLEMEVEIIIFLYRIACKFTSEEHINQITCIIKKRVLIYIKKKKNHIIYRLLLNINEYSKLYFIFKLIFENKLIFDFLKCSKNVFSHLNAYNFNNDLSVSLNSNCSIYHERVYKLKNYFFNDTGKVPKNLCDNVFGNDKCACQISNYNDTNISQCPKNHENCCNIFTKEENIVKTTNLKFFLNILDNMYKKDKLKRNEMEKNKMNICYDFNNLYFTDLLNLYERNVILFQHKNNQNKLCLFYDDHFFVYILAFYISIYCKQFNKGNFELIITIYKKIGLKYELYKLLHKRTKDCINMLKSDKDIFENDGTIQTIIFCINILHHCALILLEIQNLYKYNRNINNIYLLILQLKYIYLYNKHMLQNTKNQNFKLYINNYIKLGSLINNNVCNNEIHEIFENIIQNNIQVGYYKIKFLNLSLENLIFLVESHPSFYETLILLKAYEKYYDDIVYSFIPKILYIQVVIYGNKKYLHDYCSYSYIDKNTIRYIVKLFMINSVHLKYNNNFPTKKYKYITIKENTLIFDFSSYIKSAINLNIPKENKKDDIFNYPMHTISLKYILSQLNNIDYKIKACKKLGSDFDDMHYECKNILNLTMT